MTRTWAEISLPRLRENFRALQDFVGPETAVACVVKADAYGHGALAVSQALENAGARWLAVNCAAEGVALRQGGITARLFVMGGVFPFEREAVFAHALTPVVHSLAELAQWDQSGVPLSVHLDLNTGMSRLGADASPAEAVRMIRALRNVHVEGLMSHFASAEDFTTGQTEDQIRRYESFRLALAGQGIEPEIQHLSSSSAVVYGRSSARRSLVRPGLATYGYLPTGVATPQPAISVRPVLTWYARLLNVRDIAAGTTVGYRARFTASRPMRIGTVAAGYADGVPHQLSTRGQFLSDGRPLPILGAVSMDLTTIDLTNAPGLEPGSAVTILGEGNDAAQIATVAGEIPYSILCGIGNRVQRVYTDDPGA